MVDDDVHAIRGAGAREMLPDNGMPFELETGRSTHRETSIATLRTKDAMARVKWDYDPMEEAISSGRVSVGEFFSHMEWSPRPPRSFGNDPE